MSTENSLSKDQLLDINIKHINLADKWYRMSNLFASELVSYSNNVAVVEVRTSDKCNLSNKELVSKLQETWKQVLSEKLPKTYALRINVISKEGAR